MQTNQHKIKANVPSAVNGGRASKSVQREENAVSGQMGKRGVG